MAAPAPAQVDARRARRELTAPRGAGDAPRHPRLADPVGSDEHRHLREAAVGVLRLERHDEQAPAQHLALLEEIDGAEIGRPGAVRDRLSRRPSACAHEGTRPGRLAEELVDRLLCTPRTHPFMVALRPSNVNSGTISRP